MQRSGAQCEPHRRATERKISGTTRSWPVSRLLLMPGTGRSLAVLIFLSSATGAASRRIAVLGRTQSRGYCLPGPICAASRPFFPSPIRALSARTGSVTTVQAARGASATSLVVFPRIYPGEWFSRYASRLLLIRRTRSVARVRRREPRSGEVLAARATLGSGRFLTVSSDLQTSECSGTETELAQLQCSGMERRQTVESGQAAGGSVPILGVRHERKCWLADALG